MSVLPISLSIHGELLHHHLRNYKDDPRSSVRDTFTLRLAALLEVFLQYHLDPCLGASIDRVATVPSSRRDAPWAIISRLRRFSGLTNPLAYDQQTGGYEVTTGLRDMRVLLVDDTFTSGRSLFSAHRTLVDAQAVVLGPVVLGRHVRPDYPPSRPLVDCAKSYTWDETKCCRCAGVLCDPPLRSSSSSTRPLFNS